MQGFGGIWELGFLIFRAKPGCYINAKPTGYHIYYAMDRCLWEVVSVFRRWGKVAGERGYDLWW
jgi:hypothetical protein